MTRIDFDSSRNQPRAEDQRWGLPVLDTAFQDAPCVLIENDPLVRLSWVESARSAQINLVVFENVDDFLSNYKSNDKGRDRVWAPPLWSIKKDAFIFIDSDLGNGVRGEIEAEKIYNLGFQNLFLSTGFSPDQFDSLPPWIKEMIDKTPPWDKLWPISWKT